MDRIPLPGGGDVNTKENILGQHGLPTWEYAISQLLHFKVHSNGCSSMGLVINLANNALVNVKLSETSAPPTLKSINNALCRDSNQEGYMVASADLPSPLLAIGTINAKPLQAWNIVAKSGDNLDEIHHHSTQQTTGISGEE